MLAKIFVLYYALSLAVTSLLCFSVLAITTYIKGIAEAPGYFVGCVAVSLLWVLYTRLRIRMARLEMVAEVAPLLYPFAALSSLALSGFLAWEYHQALVTLDFNPVLLVLCGMAVALFIFVKSFDIRFMRSKEEID